MFDSHRGHSYDKYILYTYDSYYSFITVVAYAPVAQTEECILSKNEVLVQLHSGAVYDVF